MSAHLRNGFAMLNSRGGRELHDESPWRFVRGLACVLVVVAACACWVASASAATPVMGSVSSTTTWTAAGSPYLVSSNSGVDTGVKLTIEDGVVVKFSGPFTSFRVSGTLDVSGSAGSPVIFTSMADDASDGLDSGSDGASSGSPGDWLGIDIADASNSSISGAVVRYAGYGSAGFYGAIKVSEGSLTLEDSTVEESLCSGVAVSPGQRLVVSGSKIRWNGHGECGLSTGAGIYSQNAYTTISDSAIVENYGVGAYLQVSSPYSPPAPPTLDSSLVWWNGRAGVEISAAGASSSDVPDGHGNNIFDNSTSATSLANGFLQLATDWVPGADWTDNWWGEPVVEETCSTGKCHGGAAPRKHLSYGLVVPTQVSRTVGPIQSDDPVWSIRNPLTCFANSPAQPDGVRWLNGNCSPNQATGTASADNVDGSSPSGMPFLLDGIDTPAPLGLPTLQNLFGCSSCLQDAGGIAGAYTSETGAPSAFHGDPVNTATGTLSETVTDVSMAGPGTPFEWVRNYNSRDATAGRLGIGWIDQYDASLEIDGGGNAVYRSGAGQQIPFATLGDGRFVSRGFDGTLSLDGGGNYVLVSRDQRTLEFNSSGQLTSIKPRNLPATSLAYTSGKLTSITDSAGRTITITYSVATPSLIEKVTLPDARYIQFGYSGGRIATVRDLRGYSWAYHYDANGYLDQIESPLHKYPLRATYDADGRVLTQTDATGNVTTFAYSSTPDNLGYDRTTVTVPDRGATVYKYSANILQSATDPLGHTTTYAHDRDFRVTAITDARGKPHSFEYDSHGNTTRDIDALSQAIVRTFNQTNQILTERDRRGATTTYHYCDSPTCSAHSHAYVEGQLESITNRAGDDRVFAYVVAGGSTPAATVGQLASMTDERGMTTSYEYDADGNQTSITSPLGLSTTMTYDAVGRLETQRDARGNAASPPAGFLTTWTYADDDQVTEVEEPSGSGTRSTTYTYDDDGRLTTKTTPDGSWSYVYDDANRLTSVTDPASGVEAYAWDDAGAMTQDETPSGAKTTYTYDGAGRLATMREPLGNVTGATPTDQSNHTWTYTYDAVGNLTSLAHPDGGTQLTGYNDVNLPVQWTDARSKVTHATYDANYNLASRTDAYGEDEQYVYDELDRLHTTTDRNGNSTTLEYFKTGERKSLTTALGETTSWTLDDDGRTDSMVEGRGNESGATPADFTWHYAYDEVGNTITKTSPPTATSPSGNSTHWTYDAASNLTSLTDARGKTTTYDVDEMDRVTAVTPPAAGASGSLATTNTYDELGRLTERTDPQGHSDSASYDADGQVTQSVTPVATTDYTYDANHNLITQESHSTVTQQPVPERVAPVSQLSPPLVDDFDRSNTGPPLSVAWSSVVRPGDGGAKVVSNKVGSSATGRWSGMWLASQRVDQDVRVTLATTMGNTKPVSVYARVTGANSSSVHGYALTLTQNSTSGSDSWAITRMNSSTSTTTLVTNATGLSAANGLRVRFVVSGSTLSGYAWDDDAWQKQLEVTDTTYAPASSMTGIGGEGTAGRLDDFRTGAYVPSAPLLDDFDRSDEGPPPSASWGSVVQPTDGAASVLDGYAVGTSGSWSQLWGNTFGPDQDVMTRVGGTMGTDKVTSLYARISDANSSSVSGYQLAIKQTSDPDTDEWSIKRIDSGVATTLSTNAVGDWLRYDLQLRFTVRGSDLIGWAQDDGVWVEQVHATDAHYAPGSSKAGLGGEGTAGSLRDFRAGALLSDLPVLDDFNRANAGPPLTGSWGGVVRTGHTGLQIASNQARGSSGDWSQLWSATLGADQDVATTLVTPMGSGKNTWLYTRLTDEHSVDIKGYALVVVQNSSAPSVDRWELRSLTSNTEGDDVVLASNDNAAVAQAGLRVRLVARGTQLVGYALIAGVWVAQVHADGAATNRPETSRAGVGGTDTTGRLDDFRGYEIAHHAPLLDDFNRANEGPPPGGDWGSVVRPGDSAIEVDRYQAAGSGSSWSQTWDQPLGPDQDVEATLAAQMGSGNYTFLYGRLQDENTSGVTGYALVLVDSYWDADIDTWQIRRITDDDENNDVILAYNDNGAPARPGLRMRFSLNGSQLTAYALVDDHWVAQVTTTDTTYNPTTSHAGIQGAYSGGRLDDFRARTTTAASEESPTTTIDYAYDRMNRLTGIDYSDATPDVTYTYDNAGLRQTMTDGIGTGNESYTYDNNSQLTSITRTGADDGTDGEITYGYDAAGNITSRTYPDTTSVTATYNANEQLDSITSSGATTTFAYDAAGNLTSTTLPSTNGYIETRSYDQAGRLDDIKSTATGPTTLSHYALTLDPNGAPTRVALTRGATSTYQAYQYDDRSRLTKACFDVTILATDCTSATELITYAYDKASNRTSQVRTGISSPGTTNYAYNTADQLASTTSSSGTKTYTYDARGNQTSDGTTTATYNLANQLTSTSAASTTTYTYDGDGKRIKSETTGGDELRYSWDPLALTGMPELTSERTPAGDPIRDYTTGPVGSLSFTTPDDTYYYHHDWQGSTSDITSAGGTAEWAYDYEPYGELRASTDLAGAGPENPILYTGQYRDAAIGAYNLRAREYDPATGRFLSTDPAAQLPDTSRLSAYGYVDGMPTTLVDPLGLFGWDDVNPVDRIGDATSAVTGAASTGFNAAVRYDRNARNAVVGFVSDNKTEVIAYGTATGLSIVQPELAPVWFGTANAIVTAKAANDLRNCDGDTTCTGTNVAALIPFKAGKFLPEAIRKQIGEAAIRCGKAIGGTRAGSIIARRSGRKAATAGEEISYVNLTKGGSIRNVGTDATHTEFADMLTQGGWAARMSKNGQVQIFSKDGAKYVLRSKNASNYDGWTADFTPAGSTKHTLEIRLGYRP